MSATTRRTFLAAGALFSGVPLAPARATPEAMAETAPPTGRDARWGTRS